MLVKLAALTLVPVVLIGGVIMNASVLVVHVDSDDLSLTLPVPLALAQIALAFAPAEVKRIELPEFEPFAPYVERIVTELQDAPDGLLVQVQDREDQVWVRKQGDSLHIRVVDGDEERVEVTVPLVSVLGVVRAYDRERGWFRTSRLLSALRAAPSGELVHVIDAEDEVTIRMW